MPAEMTPTLREALALSEQYAMIDLWEIDLRILTNEQGEKGQLYRFYAGKSALDQPILWQGKSYVPYGVSASGFKLSSQGASNRPTLTLGNVNGFITALVNEFDQCLGAVVRRRRVYAKFLDESNFPDGNPYADPNQEIIYLYVIEQLSSMTRELVTFTLASPAEMDAAIIPARTILTVCPFVYRGAECGYSGTLMFDEKDQPTDDPKKDRCSKCDRACRLRGNRANFGGFVSVNKLG